MALPTTPELLANGFEIGAYDPEQIGAHGSASIPVAVLGYWSRDPIQIRVAHDWRWERGTDEHRIEWKVSVSHSSGGRDSDVLGDDVAAERNFGKALIAAADEADKIRTHFMGRAG
jgi:hypothetical protein